MFCPRPLRNREHLLWVIYGFKNFWYVPTLVWRCQTVLRGDLHLLVILPPMLPLQQMDSRRVRIHLRMILNSTTILLFMVVLSSPTIPFPGLTEICYLVVEMRRMHTVMRRQKANTGWRANHVDSAGHVNDDRGELRTTIL